MRACVALGFGYSLGSSATLVDINTLKPKAAAQLKWDCPFGCPKPLPAAYSRALLSGALRAVGPHRRRHTGSGPTPNARGPPVGTECIAVPQLRRNELGILCAAPKSRSKQSDTAWSCKRAQSMRYRYGIAECRTCMGRRFLVTLPCRCVVLRDAVATSFGRSIRCGTPLPN